MPHLRHPEVLNIGMGPMQGAWLEPACDPEAHRQHKRERRAALGEAVYALVPEWIDAACELAQAILREVNGDETALSQAPRSEWLWLASLQVHEDLVVMAPDGDSYTLAAASLCSPSHWRLPEKIGRPMARVHDPIPGIHERLTPRIDRIFHNLRVDTPVQRFNWSIQRDSALFAWPEDHTESIDPSTSLFYRVERQTLTRLPASGALAFTIRVHMDPLESLLAHPGAMTALFSAIDATPEALKQYKTFDWLAPALDKYRTMANRVDAPTVSSA